MSKTFNNAKLIGQVTVTDPDSKGEVDLSIYKHEGGGIFAMDSSYLEQCCDEDEYPVIPDPFSALGVTGKVSFVMLAD